MGAIYFEVLPIILPSLIEQLPKTLLLKILSILSVAILLLILVSIALYLKLRKKLMIQFRHNVSISESPPHGKLYDDSKGTEIDKRFCHNCDSFRANK